MELSLIDIQFNYYIIAKRILQDFKSYLKIKSPFSSQRELLLSHKVATET